jgi:hypothetical protein
MYCHSQHRPHRMAAARRRPSSSGYGFGGSMPSASCDSDSRSARSSPVSHAYCGLQRKRHTTREHQHGSRI